MTTFKKLRLLSVLTAMFLFLSLSAIAQAQDIQETLSISATFSYTWESPMMAITDDYTVMHGIEPEVWAGDLEGTADAIWRLHMYNSTPTVDAWIMSEFTGTMFGEYEGTMTILLVGDNPGQAEPIPAQWYGEWSVVDGTGDFENVHGSGIWWGPGNPTNADPEHDVQEIAIMGEVVFMVPTS